MLAGDVAEAIESPETDTTQTLLRFDATNSNGPSGIVFVDASVPNLDQLTAGITAGYDLVLLTDDQSGLKQISDVLHRHHGIKSVHIVAHGCACQIRIGNETVTEQTLIQAQTLLRGWSRSLSRDADILVYGCETAAGTTGEQFLRRLATLTGADVAGSTNKSGGTTQNGDWTFERAI
jgi:Domain of unknown function (DUF4347)